MDPKLYAQVVSLASFLAVFLAVFAANAVLLDVTSGARRRLKQRMEEQSRERQRLRARQGADNFSQVAAAAASEQVQVQEKSILQLFKNLLDQSGLETSASHFMTFSVACAAVMGAVGFVMTRNPVSAFSMTIVGACIPATYIIIKRTQRIQKLRAQMPDAMEMMSRVLRSGQTISQAMQAVADEFAQPISLEFLYCHEQMNLGIPAESALRDLSRRSGLLEIKIFVLAVIVNRQTGGNLAELLDKLSVVIRERFRIQGMIKALTAQGRFQGIIMLSLPPCMFAYMLIVNTEYEMMLVRSPMWLIGALVSMTVGAVWIRSIVNFDY